MHRATVILVLCILFWASTSFVKPAFCHPATVQDVAARDVEGATHLDITVLHNIESALHYVDVIEVTWGDNVTSMTVVPKSLAADGTFTVDYNMGPVSGVATITVRARCSVTGYSGAISWTGTITGSSTTPTPTPTPTPTLAPTSSPSPSPSPTPTPSPTATATASPNPTPTPSIPELPSVIILPLLMTIVAAGALLYKKRQL